MTTGQERIEGLGGHRIRPAFVGDKTRVARQGQQTAATLAAPRRQFGSEHAAQGPAAEPGVVRQGGVEFVEPFMEVAGIERRQRLDLHLQVFVQATQGGGQWLQRRYAEAPAGQQDQSITHGRAPWHQTSGNTLPMRLTIAVPALRCGRPSVSRANARCRQVRWAGGSR